MTQPLPAPVKVPRPGRRRRRILRTVFWTLGLLLLLPVLAWICAAAYLYSNREKVLADVLKQLNENLGGSLTVSRMEPTLLGDFPNVSIALYDVSLRDSLWNSHHRDLLAMKRVYVKVSPLSLIKGGLQVHNVKLADGSFDLFTDSTGYSNGYLLKSKDTSTKTRREGPDIRRAQVENVRFTFQHAPKAKLFKMHIRSLAVRARDKGEVEALTIKLEAHIGGLGFNLDRGSFARNKVLKTALDVSFNKRTRVISIPLQDLEFNDDVIQMAAQAYIGPEHKRYNLRFVAPEISLDSGATFLAENISSKLSLVKLREPVRAEARIKGEFSERNPRVHVSFAVEDDVLSTPAGDFSECSFTGFFDNEVVAGVERLDPNSIIEVDGFRGTYKDIPIVADTLAILDLKHPRAHAVIRSKFKAAAINNLTGGKTFRFAKGDADFNLRYDGSLSLVDDVVPALSGTVNIRGAEGTYVPRGLPLLGINASLVFKGVDVQFPRVNFRTGSSNIQMSGLASNLLGALHRPEVPASLRWSVASPAVDLTDFLPFLQKRAGAVARPQANRSTPLADRLDDVLDRADARLTAAITTLTYQRFRADAVRADVTLTRTQARVQNASLRHAGGTIQVTGEAEQGENGGPFKMNAVVRDVNVNGLFTAFENFGQDALKSENIRGLVSFDADLTGRLAAGGKLQQQSLAGRLDFNVRKGALVSFEPLEKVGRYIFRNRNLSDLRFEVLKARFNLANERIEIEPMEVRSSALSLNLVGVYGLKSGTDISFQVPLRNPKKDSVDLAREADYEVGQKGIVVHLRAQNPTGKKLDIGWDKGGKIYKRRVAGGDAGAAKGEATEATGTQPDEKMSRKERRKARREGR